MVVESVVTEIMDDPCMKTVDHIFEKLKPHDYLGSNHKVKIIILSK
jgi:hypothetical protein